MRITMSGEVFSRSLPLQKALGITKSFGISNFELWAGNCEALSSTCHPRLYKDRDIRNAKQQLEAAGIHTACVAFGGAFHAEVVGDNELYVEELIRAIEVADELGAEFVNHYCNLIAPKPELDLDVLDRYYSKPLKRAEELGVTMVLENEAHDMTHVPENVLAIVNHFQSKRFLANLDATNFYQAGNEAFPYCYEVLKDVIGYVHIKNGCIYRPGRDVDEAWKGGRMAGHLAGNEIYYTLPTSGAVNITALVQQLRTDGYEGYVTLEPHSTLQNVLVYYDIAVPWLYQLVPDEVR